MQCEEILELQNEVSKLKQTLEENLSKLSNVRSSQEQKYRTRSYHSKNFSSTSLKRRPCSWLRGDEDVSDRKLSLYSSTNGLNLHRQRMNSCFLCSKKTPHKIFSEGSSGSTRRGLISSLGISATATNKWSEMYDTIEYPPISNGSRIYYSPTCEVDKIESPVLPNQFYSTRSLLRGNIGKSNNNAQILHLNTTLDRAIEAANSMKKTTRRMIKILSADLAKAEYYKYLYDF
ncbi:uncharacterized protein LOC109915492 isoform X2 [Rhincodon typus]|uniref:uncharacterized protein LOC109915492 isoform X2 n=1 Tax=Rhincodon typus TaxID=259920 RepID=UPI00202FFEBA|nr:uncharacterized protein LOC109915492 isoform X2 [Rhincodon typus]